MNNITLNMAALEYFLRLQSKRTPKGKWLNRSYFFPCKKIEYKKCCAAFELETERNPRALWEHCKSIEHVANRHQVDPVALESRIKELTRKGR